MIYSGVLFMVEKTVLIDHLGFSAAGKVSKHFLFDRFGFAIFLDQNPFISVQKLKC